jgi:hypothetical protein
MLGALILAVSLVALAQFFVYYCRAVIAASSDVRPSDITRDLSGQSGPPKSDDFPCLVVLSQVCSPESGGSLQMRAVRAYFSLLRRLKSLIPSAASWFENECRHCAHFAAVELDRSVARNRELFGQRHSPLP